MLTEMEVVNERMSRAKAAEAEDVDADLQVTSRPVHRTHATTAAGGIHLTRPSLPVVPLPEFVFAVVCGSCCRRR
jgi:hypothetical protein